MSSETIKLDIRGRVCPSCLLLTLREVNARHADLQAGLAVIEVLTDSRDATGTIPAAVRNMGLAASVDRVAGDYRIVITNAAEQG
jgi:TusA-related sulfurtransferase